MQRTYYPDHKHHTHTLLLHTDIALSRYHIIVMVYGEYTRTSDVTDYSTYYHLVMADQAEEEHCTTPSGARGARPRQPKQRKIVTSPLSDTARRLLVVKCSAADQQAGRHSAIDRQQFRFTCVSANAISDTRHGWQPVSTASCRGRTKLRMACYF